jgi:hypothetical protein
MGQESLTRFDQPKRKKQTKNQSQQWKTDRLAKIKLSQTTKNQQIPPIRCKRKETCNNKKTNNYY